MIPLPPKEEMDVIASILENTTSLEMTLLSYLQGSSQLELLKQSILSKAFRGELRTNDPSEESSIELLKKVLQ